MNPIFHQIVSETTKKYYEKKKKPINEKKIKRTVKNLEIEIRHELSDFFYLLVGVLSATFGLEGFLMPSSFIDGGVTGISLMVQELTGISLAILIVLFNLPFLILAFSAISKRFAIKSIIGILLLSLSIQFIHFPIITEDKILVAAFGGLFLGLGIGMAIRGGAIIDGTEVLAIYISRKTSMTVGNVILVFNLFVFLTAAYVFSIEIALYAILTYYAASKTVDFVIDGIEEYTGVTIISDKSERIRLAIIHTLGRGCTIFSGKKGFAAKGEPLADTNIVYTVITRLEMSKLKTEIDKIDEDAFIIMTSVKDTKGGMIKKKPINKIK
ncbi:MAG: YitT family protein [Saprospiraceae bacterium]